MQKRLKKRYKICWHCQPRCEPPTLRRLCETWKAEAGHGAEDAGTAFSANNLRGAMTTKLCELCGDKPATVPDRERMGRLINRVCNSCHALRLKGDLKRIMELEEKRRR